MKPERVEVGQVWEFHGPKRYEVVEVPSGVEIPVKGFHQRLIGRSVRLRDLATGVVHRYPAQLLREDAGSLWKLVHWPVRDILDEILT